MLPGSQSSKLKQATLGISGDPRFRLMSTLPKSPWIFVGIVGVAVAVSITVMILADGAKQRQQNVVAVHDCITAVHASFDVHTHALDETHAAAAVPCFETIKPIGEAIPDQLVGQIQASLSNVRRLNQEGQAKLQVEAIRTLLDEIDEFSRWYIQNKARYSIH